MAGQAHHFLRYAPAWSRRTTCPTPRTATATRSARLYGVLDRRLADRDFVAGDYSIADMAIWPWASGWENQEQDIDAVPAHDGLARAGRGAAGGAGRRGRSATDAALGPRRTDREAQKILFGQAARG